MAAKAPVSSRVLLQLPQLGIGQESIKFKNVTLQSNKYVCVLEEGKNSVAIIDTATKNVMRLPVAVDSAIMNPISKVVALRAQNNLQIYNLEMKTKMKQTQVSSAVVFWKWLDPKTIAIVTDAAVFHWSMDGDQQPQKIFDRTPYNGAVQIINYRASADRKWLMLGGIAAGAGGVTGVLQVYSVDAKASQPPMDAHAACFANVTVDGKSGPSNLFCFTKTTPEGTKLNIIEVGVPKAQAFTQSCAMRFQAGDFPVGMLPDNKHGILFVVSKMGFLFMYEVQSGKCIFAQQASQATMFAQIESEATEGGIVAVDQTGRVSHFFVDEQNIVGYICNTMNDYDLGVALAKRFNLPGAENIFVQQFTRMMQANRHQEAMELAAGSPQGILRTMDTINALKAIPGGQGLLQYFQMLLKAGTLNKIESIELARPVLARNNQQSLEHIKGWLKENKLEASEDLGDLLKTHNVTLALSVYLRAEVPEKVIGCFLTLAAQEQNEAAAQEHLKNILNFAAKVSYHPDYPLLLQQLISASPDRAKDLALMLILHPDGAKADINLTVDTFMRQNDVKNTTNILLEYLKPRGDLQEDAILQTRLLEINLMQMPQVADAIMESPDYSFTHYDKPKIAMLCERAQLYQRALEHYTDLADIKRVLTHSHLIQPDFLLDYFGRMTPENCLELLRDLLKFNLQQNIRLVVEVAKKWSDYLTPDALTAMFEEFKSYNGIYFYLGSFVNTTEDTEVVFKYIEAACQLNQLKEVERVCRDNDHYEAVKVKEFLLGQNLKDPRPLIHVCDRYDFVDELTQHLFSNNMYMFIEAYVQRMNVKAAPKVLGSLLDMNANEDNIKKLLDNLRPPADDADFVDKLVAEIEKRNRLKLLRPFLEARNQEGSEDPFVHNGLAKIYVDVNNNPQQFLAQNRFYDSAVVGAYCESRDPHLAFVAYKRAGGPCDDQLIAVTNKNGFFKDQARYLVERQDEALWDQVLSEDNEFKRQLIDQVVATALPESRVPEEVSATVKAFMNANLPNELIELLERIILHGANSEFNNNRNLQNLLILTAIKADGNRVMDYIKRLENFDGPDIAKIAVSDAYKLYEEAFFIYKKFKKGEESIQVLLENMEDIPRAVEFAEYWDQAPVWSILAVAQLQAGQVKEAIQSFLKADDATQFSMVIAAAKTSEFFGELISFIQMARGKLKDAQLDGELIYCFAKTAKLAELEEFINGSHIAKISECGDRSFDEGLYHAAKILYNHVNNNAKLAICLVRLTQFQEAVNAAQKANAIPTWKAVCFACVDASEFRLAQMCGINIIVYMDQLNELIRHYEHLGFFSELIALLEQGINLDRAHQGIYTQLGVCYCKYREEKVMEHIKLFWSRLNIPTLLGACQQNLHWAECVFLYSNYDQFDNAVDVLMDHSAECWEHELFKTTLKQVANVEIYYRGVNFYLTEHPLLLNDLLLDLVSTLDHIKVVGLVRQAGCLALIEKYLHQVQRENVLQVNEAVNELHLEAENHEALRASIDEFSEFDQAALAQRLETHELLEFRRIAAHLFKLGKKWERSLEISKRDSLWADSMQTTADSKDTELAEKLLNFFVAQGQKECVSACLYTCYELIRPDVVLEMAWRHNMMDFAMPYMIQSFRQFSDELGGVRAKLQAQDDAIKVEAEAQKKVEAEQQNTDAAFVGNVSYNPMMEPLALAPPPGGMYQQQQQGYPQQQQGFPQQQQMGYPQQQQQQMGGQQQFFQ